MKRCVTIGAVAIGLVLSGCGGDEEDTTTGPAPAAGLEAPGTAPPSASGALPPEFLECMAEQGFDVESSGDFHSAPPEVFQACLGALHGDGAP